MKRIALLAVIGLCAALSGGCSKNPADSDNDKTPAGMKLINGGTFLMGDSVYTNEQSVHTVTLSPFYMDSTEVTQGDYLALMGSNPSHFSGNVQRPVDSVTWNNAIRYCNARSKRDGNDTVYDYSGPGGWTAVTADFTRNGYRLPTEAEWEYACRAGTSTGYYWGSDYPLATAEDTAAVDSNAVWYDISPYTQPVASKKPNAWGLYDMIGNVREWCNDWYAGNYYSAPVADPTGPSDGSIRVMRGGSWYDFDYRWLRSAYRYGDVWSGKKDYYGFRCVRR